MTADIRTSGHNPKIELRLHDYNLSVKVPGISYSSMTRARNLDSLRRNLISTFHTDPNHQEVKVSVSQIDDNRIGAWRRLGELTMIGKKNPCWTPIGGTDGIDVNVRTGKLMG